MLKGHRNMSAEEGPTVKTDAKLLYKFMNTQMIAVCFLHLFVCTLACVSALIPCTIIVSCTLLPCQFYLTAALQFEYRSDVM